MPTLHLQADRDVWPARARTAPVTVDRRRPTASPSDGRLGHDLRPSPDARPACRSTWVDTCPAYPGRRRARRVGRARTCAPKSPAPRPPARTLSAVDRRAAPIVEGVALSLPTGSAAIATLLSSPPQLGQFTRPADRPPSGSRLRQRLAVAVPSATRTPAPTPPTGTRPGCTSTPLKQATIAAPTIAQHGSGFVTTTAFPTLSAVVSRPLVESWQLYAGGEFCTTGARRVLGLPPGRRRRRRLAAGRRHAGPAPGADPSTCNTYIDGVTPSTLAVSLQAAAPLPDDSYVVYARAVRDHPSGSDADPTGTSAWTAYQRLAWVQLVGGAACAGLAGYARRRRRPAQLQRLISAKRRLRTPQTS